MKILLHIGSPKAGSSFLQSVCARFRSKLAAQGIHFPKGTPHDESSMLRGRISAGNALHLARFMRDDDWTGVRSWLERSVVATQAAGCQTLLLSSEWLLGSLARTDRLGRLERILRDQGATQVELLLILRDPASQLISLYKHRAKLGEAPPIDRWVSTGYDLPQRLGLLRKQLPDSGADLKVRAYGRSHGALEQLFFEDWLKTGAPSSAENARVNPSLSLSELVLLRRLRAHHPGLVPILYERLLAVESTLKVESESMQAYALQVAANAVAEHAAEWRAWNALLPESERFEIPEAGSAAGSEPEQLALSSEQLGAVMALLADATRPRLRWRLFWTHRLRPILARFKRIVFPWYSRR